MAEINITGLSDDSGITGRIINSADQASLKKSFLNGRRIGISISESENLRELGMDIIHLKDAMIEFARYVLASGGNLAYGGDLRNGGFTELLFDLLKHYKDDEDRPAKRLNNYLAWPIYLQVTNPIEASLSDKVTFKKIPPPRELNISNLNIAIPPDTIDHLVIWAESLSEMRKQMEKDCAARIFMGGKNSRFKGKCPGLLEEFLIAIENNHPIYLVGAYGGVTSDILNAIEGKKSDLFNMDYYSAQDGYSDFINVYNSKYPKNAIDYDLYYQQIMKLGYMGLEQLNGLSKSDNERLAHTPHIQEIAYLIMKGLNRKLRKS